MDLMCQANGKYLKYVTYENGKKVLYLCVLRAIYGCIESALLWYELFSSKLKSLGFHINPYDKCIANKMINGSQCTIVWYVDDVKISLLDPKVVTEMIDVVEKDFGNVKAVRGKEHDYLDMKLIITDDKKVRVDMRDQIKETISAFGEVLEGTVTSPAARHLMMVNEECEKLPSDKQELFHSITAKLLYLEKQARPDIEPTVAFLYTRVSNPDLDISTTDCE